MATTGVNTPDDAATEGDKHLAQSREINLDRTARMELLREIRRASVYDSGRILLGLGSAGGTAAAGYVFWPITFPPEAAIHISAVNALFMVTTVFGIWAVFSLVQAVLDRSDLALLRESNRSAPK